MKLFDRSFELEPAGSANINHPMLIIVGVARSGTTLLTLMLDAHPQLAVTHEAGFYSHGLKSNQSAEPNVLSATQE
jgi:hypothetical protein